ncbi:polysaccharide deacetylase family protein [Flavobacterium sp.]|uniref:polysaccharide deacetylase family protein n=1 Tax=Flavobacterium sp. TaxID=239 RepID=UPI000EBFDA23|nr:polysaccharide deacetylase family protein [Flavobacterium sp.]HCQ11999.1 hypothetical protein [Flavobacterium sp.]
MLNVCNYHYIRENFESKFPSIFGVTPLFFEKQLKAIRNIGDFITPAQLVDDGESILNSNDTYYLVSFDDGLKEQIEIAVPILEDLNLQAIFFANSINRNEQKVSVVHKIHLLRSIISSKEMFKKMDFSTKIALSESDKKEAIITYRFDDKESAILKYVLNFKLNFKDQELIIGSIFKEYFDENEVLDNLYMTEKDLEYLAKKGCLGSHTHSHYPLGLLADENIKFELQYSKKYLEELASTNIKLVSYPYGTPETATETVAEIACDLGYKFGFTTTKGTNSNTSNRLLLNRFDCNDLIGGKNYRKKI